VTISGEYAIVGAHGHDTGGNSSQGKAYIFHRSETVWTQQDMLTASDGATADGFGVSVSISGDYAIVGAHGHDTGGNNNQGKAYVFHYSGIAWTQQDILTASDGATDDRFGERVSISGDYAIVGAPYHDIGGNDNQGKAYVFHRSGIAWTPQSMLTASDGDEGDHFGEGVSISADHAIVGAYGHDTNGTPDQGKAYFFGQE
jgi:hypothetical protein